MPAKPKYQKIGWAFLAAGFFWQAALIVMNGILLRAKFIEKIPNDVTVYKFTVFGTPFVLPEMIVPLLLVSLGSFGVFHQPILELAQTIVKASKWGKVETKGGKK